jgi:hypothetical protein
MSWSKQTLRQMVDMTAAGVDYDVSTVRRNADAIREHDAELAGLLDNLAAANEAIVAACKRRVES